MVKVNRSCFVPGCYAGFKKTKQLNKEKGVKDASLFTARSEAQIQTWRRVIPRKDRIFKDTDVVCEKHFAEGDIIRYFETKMPDGSIDRIERERPRLRPHAFPTIFPNLPKYLSKVVKKRKPPMDRNRGESLELGLERSPSPDIGRISEVNNLELLAEVAAGMNALEDVMTTEEVFNATVSTDVLKCVKLPGPNWTSAFVGSNLVFLSLGNNFSPEKTLVVTEDLQLKVIIHGKEVSVDDLNPIKDQQDLLEVIELIDKLRLCKGIPGSLRKYKLKIPCICSKRSAQCCGYVKEASPKQNRRGSADSISTCVPCKLDKKRLTDRDRKHQQTLENRKRKSASKDTALLLSRRKAARLVDTVGKMKRNMKELQKECAEKSEEKVNAQISILPLPQQEAIKACFTASKIKSRSGMRYDCNWVYECLLLRIKSRKAYEHLRAHNILALPSINTLSHYLEKIKGRYGFQEATFQSLKEKAVHIPQEEKRGAILVDEMKLSKSLTFDRGTLEINGFTNLDS